MCYLGIIELVQILSDVIDHEIAAIEGFGTRLFRAQVQDLVGVVRDSQYLGH